MASALLALMHRDEVRLDTMLMSEVMFDKKHGISGENPVHIGFVRNVAKPYFEQRGIEVLILRSDRDYLDCFRHVIERPTRCPEHRGMMKGFPYSGSCVIQRDCKLRPINNYLRSLTEQGIEIHTYLGIASDEPKRLESMKRKPNTTSLLEKYGYTEEMARELCEENGLLSPVYEYSTRQGCWMCPNARDCEAKSLIRSNPDAWESFVALEQTTNIVYRSWNPHAKETLSQRSERLKAEIMTDNI